MGDFIRARSPEQKEQRMEEIKAAASALYDDYPYHEITLSTIADRLSWTRANLYRYVSTKEEVFLELTEDAMSAYYEDFLRSLQDSMSKEQIADAWVASACRNMGYFRFGGMLVSIVETNVSVDRLAKFKKMFRNLSDELSSRIAPMLNISEQDAFDLQVTIYHHGTGLAGGCYANPIMIKAMEMAGLEIKKPDFEGRMRRFIQMCLNAPSQIA